MKLGLRAFHFAPDSYDDRCVCSLCGKRFEILDVELGDYSFPIRLFSKNEANPSMASFELRFHAPCFELVYWVSSGSNTFAVRPDVVIVLEWGDDAKTGALLRVSKDATHEAIERLSR